MARTKTVDVATKIVPLLMACDRTLEDLVNETGFTVPQIKHAWKWIKDTHHSDLTVGVDPEGWVWCMTDDPERCERIQSNRGEDLITRHATLDLALYRPMLDNHLITPRYYRLMENLKDEAIYCQEQMSTHVTKRVAKKVHTP